MTKQDLNETNNKTILGQMVGYARVSSLNQNLERQLKALEEAGRTKIFREKISGISRDRQQLEEALSYFREGDVLVCASMDRIARSLIDLHTIIDELTSKGIEVHFLKEGQKFSRNSDSVATLMLGILGAVAAFERNLIRERHA